MTNTVKIAIGSRLKHCRNVITLGFKPNFTDYSAEETQLIRNADKIYYPTAFYAHLFYTMGKPTFPNFTTYHFVQDKIRQTAIFNLLNIPHPYTKVFYGTRQKREILNTFSFPFIAKKPRGSSMGRGVYLINNMEELLQYLSTPHFNISPKEVILPNTTSDSKLSRSPAYIQEYCPHDRDIRVVVIGSKVAIAYWRVANSKDFRANISCGGDISFDKVPNKAIELALDTAIKCGWDDVGLDIIQHKGEFLVVEANMKYGRKGFAKAGIDYNILLENLIAEGTI
ncbi:MAG: RimK family alpha-L-glutamate ligase [Desulfamplus sp.]|nr:RimK family alpha-L-glutamate ligase [Desulfamplus sp.]